MLLLTRSKREQLIDTFKKELVSYECQLNIKICLDQFTIDYIELAKLKTEIALASLMAQEIDQIIDDDESYGRCMGGEVLSNAVKYSWPVGKVFFDSPPITDIKLPTEKEIESWFVSSDDDFQSREEWDLERGRRMASVNACKLTIEEIKRLNGLA